MPTERRDGIRKAGPPLERRARPSYEPDLPTSLDLAFEDDLTGLRNRRFVTRLAARLSPRVAS